VSLGVQREDDSRVNRLGELGCGLGCEMQRLAGKKIAGWFRQMNLLGSLCLLIMWRVLVEGIRAVWWRRWCYFGF
jgi:hypothetical protein